MRNEADILAAAGRALAAVVSFGDEMRWPRLFVAPRIKARNEVIQHRRRRHGYHDADHKLCPVIRPQRAEGHDHEQDWDVQEVRERRKLLCSSVSKLWCDMLLCERRSR